eukprot:CAMPEP_0201509186 /NCGR_PEP_ID=MMETSP0161_2-20130828/2310_1 /ASSEMBLY_ACC=CAM_ASM_000251 /TAXON_ID=180227 /ORGANISM="Neoparamoeba aestuarina, Strain SoJaBio B1-5/56/2" /LENGTH=536 /DNA_ID=CAMNT_0047904061 /DNA_START=223 /DNA_END=1830 /DNA_ORIENTATION=-
MGNILANTSTSEKSSDVITNIEQLLEKKKKGEDNYFGHLKEVNAADTAADYYYTIPQPTPSYYVSSLPEFSSSPKQICSHLSKEIAGLSCDENTLPLERGMKLLCASSDLQSRIDKLSKIVSKAPPTPEKGKEGEKKEKENFVYPSSFFDDVPKREENAVLKALKAEKTEEISDWLRDYSIKFDSLVVDDEEEKEDEKKEEEKKEEKKEEQKKEEEKKEEEKKEDGEEKKTEGEEKKETEEKKDEAGEKKTEEETKPPTFTSSFSSFGSTSGTSPFSSGTTAFAFGSSAASTPLTFGSTSFGSSNFTFGSKSGSTPTFSFQSANTSGLSGTQVIGSGAPKMSVEGLSKDGESTAGNSGLRTSGGKPLLEVKEVTTGEEGEKTVFEQRVKVKFLMKAEDIEKEEKEKEEKKAEEEKKEGERKEEEKKEEEKKDEEKNRPAYKWVERGAGPVKINVSNDDPTKSRVLYRLEGSGRLIFNLKIWEKLNFEKAGEKSVRLVGVEAGEGDGVVMKSFAVRFDRAPEANQLIQKLTELKKKA